MVNPGRSHFDPVTRVQSRPATQPFVADSNHDSYHGYSDRNHNSQSSNHSDVHSNSSRVSGHQGNVLSAAVLNQYNEGHMTTMDRRYPYMIKDAYQKYWKEPDYTKNTFNDKEFVQHVSGVENRDIVV